MSEIAPAVVHSLHKLRSTPTTSNADMNVVTGNCRPTHSYIDRQGKGSIWTGNRCYSIIFFFPVKVVQADAKNNTWWLYSIGLHG